MTTQWTTIRIALYLAVVGLGSYGKVDFAAFKRVDGIVSLDADREGFIVAGSQECTGILVKVVEKPSLSMCESKAWILLIWLSGVVIHSPSD
jgi:hypothetical protein